MNARNVLLMMLVSLILVVVVAACAPASTPVPPTAAPKAAEPTKAAAPTKIVWWSHWAEEENKRAVIDQVSADYKALHQNLEIEIVWWQKANMWPAIQNSMTAGTGFPDIFYFDVEKPEFIKAGWLADLSKTVNWDNVQPWAKSFWTQDGKIYALGLEASTEEIYYNTALFDKLGIKVPENRQTTADEFLEIAKKCRAAGYDPLGQPGSAYPLGAQRVYKYILLSQLGPDKFEKYFQGDLPSNDPDALKAIEYAQKLMAIPALPKTYSTLNLAEAHTYFHTQQKSCMFIVGSWYTGRAFVPPEKGGQPADFRVSFLKYPTMPGGAGNNVHFLSVAGSMAVAEKSSRKDVALDILKFFAQDKYANLWVAKTGVQTGIKTNPATMPKTAYDWYFAEYERVHKGLQFHVHNTGLQPPELKAAWQKAFSEGLALNLISVNDAVKILEDARAKVIKK